MPSSKQASKQAKPRKEDHKDEEKFDIPLRVSSVKKYCSYIEHGV